MSELTEPRVAEGYHFDHEMPRLAPEPTATPLPPMPDEFAPGGELPPTIDPSHAPRLPGADAPLQMTPPPADVIAPPLPNTIAIEPGAPNLPSPAPTPSAPAAAVAPATDLAPPAPPSEGSAPSAMADPADIADVAAHVAAEADAEAAATARPHHPMAHLMPQKPEQTEASKRAAEQRAAKKKKSKQIKIGMAIGFLAIAAVAGPPLGKWLVNAVNEAGSTGGTEVEEPAREVDEEPTTPDTEQGRIDALLDETRDRLDLDDPAQP